MPLKDVTVKIQPPSLRVLGATAFEEFLFWRFLVAARKWRDMQSKLQQPRMALPAKLRRHWPRRFPPDQTEVFADIDTFGHNYIY